MKDTVLITGGAGGIGLSFAEIFASNNYDLVIVDINAEKLEEIRPKFESKYGIKVTTLVKNLALDGVPQEIYDELKQKNIEVDILVNNAGFGDFGRFIDISYQLERSMAGVNMITVMHMMHLFDNEMVKRGKGRILNISSIAAFEPGPYMPMYYATKAFILSLSQAVSKELEGTGVTVTALCPGPTTTNFEKTANMRNSKMFTFFKAGSPDMVAMEGYKAVMRGKSIHVPQFRFKLFKFITRFGSEKTKCDLATYINTGEFK